MRVVISVLMLGCAAFAEGPYQATGIKIGEVRNTSAIVWTRLTRNPERVGIEAPMPVVTYRDTETGEVSDEAKSRATAVPIVKYPNNTTVETIEGAAPGSPGEVRVTYRIDAGGAPKTTEWRAVETDKDFTRQFVLDALHPDTSYSVTVESRAIGSDAITSKVSGGFKTAPLPTEPARVVFTVSTGQMYDDRDALTGFRIYPAMLKLKPDFFVHTGDILYYDNLGKALPLARWHWQRTYSLPTNVEFHRQVSSYFMKDDHDTWMNDCWPTMKSPFMGDFTFAQGQRVFLEQVPMDGKTYRTFRWGKDLQIWLVEGRDFRTPNDMPDGPDKTILGAEQMAWFKKTVTESDVSFRVLISPMPILGPDRENKNDNHANAGFRHEGDELRGFIASQKNMVIVCGDRHWQYISVDAVRGIREYSCGPASDAHAGGWNADDVRPEHRYLNVAGGFMSMTVERSEEKPVLVTRHYSVDGSVLNEDRLEAED